MKFKEQITIKNIKHFPSMEWGEDGGTSADIYYKGKKILNYVNYGDGGEEYLYWENIDFDKEILTNAVRNCLKRLNLYDAIIIKSGDKIIECDLFGFLIMHFEELKEMEKYYKKALKQNYNIPIILYALFTERFVVKQTLKNPYELNVNKLIEEYEKSLFFRYSGKFKESEILQKYVVENLDFFKEV